MIYVQMSTLRHAFLSFGYDKTIRYFVKSLLCQDFYHTPIPKNIATKDAQKVSLFKNMILFWTKMGKYYYQQIKMTGN